MLQLHVYYLRLLQTPQTDLALASTYLEREDKG
jgi:hypothetical protein